jgi:hypothetical protein
MTVNGLEKSLKKQARGLMEQGVFFPLRNCGFTTINEIRRWVGIPELDRKQYYRINRKHWQEHCDRNWKEYCREHPEQSHVRPF